MKFYQKSCAMDKNRVKMIIANMLIYKERYGQLNITDVRVRLIPGDEENKLKASASITIDDCFVVHDIKIREGQQGLFVCMPKKRTPDGETKDIAHPLNTPTREMINKVVLAKYEEEVAKNK